MRRYFQLIPLVLAFLSILLCMPAAASGRKAVINGGIYSAETNQPVKGAIIKFFGTHRKKPPASVVASTDQEGKFRSQLVPGIYRYSVAGAGFAVFEGTVSVIGNEPVMLTIPLNKAGTLSGRIVDPSGRPLAGLVVSAGAELKSVTDGRGAFRIPGMDARGYDIQIARAGWITEKPLYVQLGAEENKDIGDITVRRTGTLVIEVFAVTGTAHRPLGRAEIYLSGELGYRNGRTNEKGEVTMAGLAPGFYTLGSDDDRIADPHLNVEVKEGERISVKLQALLRPPMLSFDDADRIYLPTKPIKMNLSGLWVDTARVTLYSVDKAQFSDGRADTGKPDTIPLAALSKMKSFSVRMKKERHSHSKTATVQLPQMKPGIYLIKAASGNTSAHTLFFVTRFGIVAKTSPTGTLLYAVDLINGKAIKGAEIRAFAKDLREWTQPDFRAETDGDGTVQYDGPHKAVRIIGLWNGNPASLDLSPPSGGGK